MTEAASNFEGLLREALVPVEPPEDMVQRLEGTLTAIAELAADELEAWELSAMRDPRNWARPAAALVAGSAAGAALLVLRARRRAQGAPATRALRDARSSLLSQAPAQTLRELGRETRRLLDR